jgi:hypothetical protein
MSYPWDIVTEFKFNSTQIPRSTIFLSKSSKMLTSSKGSIELGSTFKTLQREETFRYPPKKYASIPILNEFVTPHIESFNSLFDDSGLPQGDGDNSGLLSLAIKDIGERVVFDGTGPSGTESGAAGWGNRMRSEFCTRHSTYRKYKYNSS